MKRKSKFNPKEGGGKKESEKKVFTVLGDIRCYVIREEKKTRKGYAVFKGK